MPSSAFDSWLSSELTSLGADEDVFRPYISSILEEGEEEGEDEEVVAESLDGVIAGFMEDSSEAAVRKMRNAILDKWREAKNNPKGSSGDGTSSSSSSKNGASASAATSSSADSASSGLASLDLGARLASITESQTAAYKAARAAQSSDGPDRAVKEAILAQYSGAIEVGEDEEEDGDCSDGGGGGGGGADLGANTNAEAVAREEQERREKSRAAAAAKKDKDKEDREKQKKEAEERKKKAQEKTAKGERRR